MLTPSTLFSRSRSNSLDPVLNQPHKELAETSSGLQGIQSKLQQAYEFERDGKIKQATTIYHDVLSQAVDCVINEQSDQAKQIFNAVKEQALYYQKEQKFDFAIQIYHELKDTALDLNLSWKMELARDICAFVIENAPT